MGKRKIAPIGKVFSTYGGFNYSRFISSMAEIYMKESESMAADDKA